MHPVQKQHQTASWHISEVRDSLPESCFEGELKGAESIHPDDTRSSDHSKQDISMQHGPSKEDCTAPLEPWLGRKQPRPDSAQPCTLESGARARLDSNTASNDETVAAESTRGAVTEVATSPPPASGAAAETHAEPDQFLDKADAKRCAKEVEALDEYAM